MTKENISATVDPEVDEYLDREDINKSGLINKLVKQYMAGDTGELQMLKLRREQVEDTKEEAEGRVETKEKQLKRINTRIKQIEGDKEKELQEAFEALDDVRGKLKPENTAVKVQADKVKMEPEKLIERYNTQYNTNNT